MSFTKIYTEGTSPEITVVAADSIAVRSSGSCEVFQLLGYPNVPNKRNSLGFVTATTTVFGPYAAGTTIVIDCDAAGAEYAMGVGPVVSGDGKWQTQGTPGVLNATGTLTSAMILSGIVTSTSAAGTVATLDTGAILDAASQFAIGDSFDWSVINTGPSTFTVTASAGHTIVGVGAVLTVISSTWRTRKTAADTFVSYRLD